MLMRIETLIKAVNSAENLSEENIARIVNDIYDQDIGDVPTPTRTYTYDDLLKNECAHSDNAYIFHKIFSTIEDPSKYPPETETEENEELWHLIVDALNDCDIEMEDRETVKLMSPNFLIDSLLSGRTYFSPMNNLSDLLWLLTHLRNETYLESIYAPPYIRRIHEKYKKLDYSAFLHARLFEYASLLLEKRIAEYKNEERMKIKYINDAYKAQIDEIARILKEIGHVSDENGESAPMKQFLTDYIEHEDICYHCAHTHDECVLSEYDLVSDAQQEAMSASMHEAA